MNSEELGNTGPAVNHGDVKTDLHGFFGHLVFTAAQRFTDKEDQGEEPPAPEGNFSSSAVVDFLEPLVHLFPRNIVDEN